ncbi:MAG: PhoU domain-containing protein [Acidilobus sp.]
MPKHDESPSITVKRRVQLTGGSTYIISIPKEWAKLLNIEKGSEVTLELSRDGWIKVSSAKGGRRREQRSIEISLRDGLSDAAISMQIIAAYLAGYDTIKVKFNPTLADLAERVVSMVRSKVVGLELLEESDSHMTLRAVVDLTSISAESALDNLVKVVKGMLADVNDVITGVKGREVLEAVVRRDDIVDKLYLYIFKQLNLALQGLMSPNELGMNDLAEVIAIYTMVKSLERIADQVVSIAQWLEDLSPGVTLSDEIKDLFTSVHKALDNALNLVKAPQREKVLELYESLHSQTAKLMQTYVSQRLRGCAGDCYPLFDGLRRILAQGIDLLEALMGLESLRSIEAS